MTSQISIRKLLKQEIRQNSWMFGLTALLHLLTGPVVFLLNTTRYSNWAVDTAGERYENFFTGSYFGWQLAAMIGCLAIGIFIYRYLFSKRMVDLYHSVPISRSRLFFTKYLHGILIWFLPFLGNAGSVTLIYIVRAAGKPYFGEVFLELLKVIALLLLCFFTFYHLFLAAVYLSGNVLNLFTNMAVMGGSVIGIASAVYACASYHFDTFCYEPSNLLTDILLSLSPLAAPFAVCGYTSSENLKSHAPLLIGSVIICLVLFYLAWVLCRRRPSELAEQGTESKRYTFLSRIAAAILVGIAGALFFGEISSDEQQLGWGIFGALLCSVMTFGALNSIYKTTIKAFFKHRAQMIACTAVSILIVVSFQLDWFGYDAYLPEKEEIAGMAIYSNQFSDGSAFYYVNENSGISSYRSAPPQSINNVPQDTFLEETDSCYDLLSTFVENELDKNGYTTFYAKVKLNSGRIYERRYRISDQNYEKLRPFVESEDYIAANYKYSTGAFGYPQRLTLDLLDTNVELNPAKNDMAEAVIQDFMDAYRADFAEHFSLEYDSARLNLFSFSGNYTVDDGSHYFNLAVPVEYERTIAVVKEYYPEYQLTIESAQDCASLSLNTNYYSKFTDGGYSIEDLYEHFGYEVSEQISENAETNASNEMTGETYTDVIEIASADGKPVPTAAAESYAELNITDQETLNKLFPLLYFGSYRDIFSLNEYIYVGYARSVKGSHIDCYAKPGTIPKEIIRQLYDGLREYE